MNQIAIATLPDGTTLRGRLTTEHSASSYGQPVFVDDNGIAYNWAALADVQIEVQQARAGRATSEAKARASRKNGKLGGRPRKP